MDNTTVASVTSSVGAGLFNRYALQQSFEELTLEALRNKLYDTIKSDHGYEHLEMMIRVLLRKGWNINSVVSEETALLCAVDAFNLGAVKLLIKLGADVNFANEHGFTPLLKAVYCDNFAIVKELVDSNANIFCSDVDGDSLLHACVMETRDNVNVLQYLIGLGLNVNAVDSDNETPLHFALSLNYLPSAFILIEHGAVFDIFDRSGYSPLFIAASDAKFCTVARLMIDSGVDVHQTGPVNTPNSGNNVLHIAVLKENIKLIPDLINCGLEIHSGSNVNNRTPFDLSVHYGLINSFICLLESGADHKSLPLEVHYVLLIKAVEKYPEVNYEIFIEIILERGGNLDEFCDGLTLMTSACRAGNLRAARVLISFGADINLEDQNGHSPLFCAIQSKNTELSEFLLDNGAHYDLDEKFNLFFHACANGLTKLAVILLRLGADINRIETNVKMNALAQACKSGNKEIFDILLRHNADVNFGEDEQMSPLFVASLYGNVEMVRELLRCGAKVNYISPFQNKIKVFPKSLAQVLGEHLNQNVLHAAMHLSHKSNVEVIDILIQYGAGSFINATDNNGQTALHYGALVGCHPTSLSKLIECGANVNVLDDMGRSPFLLSNLRKKFKIENVNILIKAGANVHQFDLQGRNALHYAAEAGCVHMIPTLLSLGLDVNSADNSGRTPLQLAMEKDLTTIVNLLIQNGAIA